MTQRYELRGKRRGQRALLLVPFLLAAACGSDNPESGYYLRGRVVDGATQEAIKQAELTLISGQETIEVVSDDEGMYKIGPIQPSASYRLDAKASGKAPFEFTGLALPSLPVGVNDLTVIGDVPLYDTDKESPAFMIKLASNDERMPVAIASVDFVPVQDYGADPKQGLGLLNPTTTTTTTANGTTTTTTPVPTTVTPAANATVIGAFAQPSATTLPNDLLVAPQTFHVNVVDGEAMIPEGALTFGATYNVKVAAGPDFSTQNFMLTAARDSEVEVVMQTTRSFLTGLQADAGQRYFTGRIYNGVTRERVKNYEMTLEFFDRVLTAKVDDEGRFIVGPVLPNADYSVSVKAEGYRSFLSHNTKFGVGSNQLSSWYYDAFLYPSNVEAPAVQARFTLDDDTKLPSGTVRFAPTSASSLVTDAPAALNVWVNSEDLQQRAIVKTFTDGKVEIAKGELVLGVQYDVTVFGAGSYQIDGGTYTAGENGNPLFTLTHLTEEAIEIVAMSSEAAALSPSGTVEIRFNQDILPWPQMDQAKALLSVNRGISIDSPDQDADSEFNTLADENADPSMTPANFRGVSWEISGNRLTLKWDREKGLSSSDTGDPINSLVYDNLNSIQIYTGIKATSKPMGLGTLVSNMTGDSEIEVKMVAQ
ncbi:MAG TPA: carboxypeptidase-like regulatory domain-containing protein [Polyangiales bacterium]|nr:carboxypeptidase-like regulatory domain-containing protein [Polyangiales bacterium]